MKVSGDTDKTLEEAVRNAGQSLEEAAGGSGDAAAPGRRPPPVGTMLRTVRKARGLSMKELSALAGVSGGMISQIERGTANPSIKILDRLRTALHIPLSALIETPGPTRAVALQETGSAEFVRRAADRPRFNVGSAPLLKELLSPSGMEGMQFMIIHFPPYAPPEDVVVGPGQKAGLVLEGQVQLVVDARDVTLYPGDSFQFDSTRPHSIRNDTDRGASVLWIMGSFRQTHF